MFLVDSGVSKTLISEMDWKLMKNKDRKLQIKKCHVKFRPYCADNTLQI